MGAASSDQILIHFINQLVNELQAKDLIDYWFFIRYNDPDFHLRVRFHLKDQTRIGEVISLFNQKFQTYPEKVNIWKVELSNYERELERYYFDMIEVSELLFSHDSVMVMGLIQLASNLNQKQSIWLYSIISIDELLNQFKFSDDDKLQLLQQLYDAYCLEFTADKRLKKQIDGKFRMYSSKIKELMKGKSAYLDIIHTRSILINGLTNSVLDKITNDNLFDFISSHIHMSINRIINSNARLHELVLYGVLAKYYKQQVGINNHALVSSI